MKPAARAWWGLVLLVALAAAGVRCGVDVVLGVDPNADAAVTDAGDAGVGG
jgi:hypothetical protein